MKKPAAVRVPYRDDFLISYGVLIHVRLLFPRPIPRDLKIRGRRRQRNVAGKVNSRSFNLHRDYSKSLTLLSGETS